MKNEMRQRLENFFLQFLQRLEDYFQRHPDKYFTWLFVFEIFVGITAAFAAVRNYSENDALGLAFNCGILAWCVCDAYRYAKGKL